MNSFGIKVIAGVLIIAAGAGSVLVIDRHSNEPAHTTPTFGALPNEPVHTAAWYVAHPDTLSQDDHRCAGDAATISPAACQNAASADSIIGAQEMKNAAAQNGALGAPNGSKSP